MGLSADDKREIREEIWNAFREIYKEQGFTMAEHMKDHQFTHDIRKSAGTIRKASLWTLTTMAISAFLGLVWCAITGKFG